MHHIRGNTQWSSDQLHVRTERWTQDLTKEIVRQFEAYGFLNPVIVQCDKEMSIIDVCRKVARERKSRKALRCARSCTRTHTGTRTMLSGTNRDEHWHTAFSNVTCHPICSSLRWISRFTVRPDGGTPFQYLLGTPYVAPLCMFGESVFSLIPDHEVRAAKLSNRWFSGSWW